MSSTRSKKNKAAARRRRRQRKTIAALVLLGCMGAAVYMAGMALGELSERRQGAGYYQELSAQLISQPTQPPEPAEPTPAPITLTESAAPEPEPQPTWQPRPSALDFDALREDCPDVVGWIRLDGQWLDYPVMQGEDNEYYLNHLPNGYMNEAGSIMLDAANDEFFRDELSILHGHHMNHGSMFGDLDQYRDAGFFREHSEMTIFTPTGDYRIELIAAWTLDGMEFGYPTRFQSDAEFDAFIAEAREGSVFVPDTQVQRGDRLILLSTCAYNFKYARFVVLGKLVPF